VAVFMAMLDLWSSWRTRSMTKARDLANLIAAGNPLADKFS